ncbi:hypothetical protein C8R46DRAFT_1042134 [Mycena filopes]|nr:hypothetical protein C8R46DRAFT_1042134 [Mycena filopes]
MANGEFKLFAELSPRSAEGGPVNCLLFLREATLLLSGDPSIGDDQIVRLWDLEEGECLQELRDPQWGQITALSWLPEHIEKAPVLFIGTGRGVVSTYPFSNERTQVFLASVRALHKCLTSLQALDPLRSRILVGAFGVKCSAVESPSLPALLPLWTIRVQDIPRGIFFHGEQNERIAVHTCCLGEVGSATLAADGSMKAVHNLSSGNFDVYYPPDSLTPITLSIPRDKGTLHLFQLGEAPQRKTLSGEESGPDAFYAVTAFSTPEYHFIAAGETQEPASIFIWRKPTQKRIAEEKKFKKLLADKENVVNQAAMKDMETKLLRERLVEMERKFHHRGTAIGNAWPWLFLGLCVFFAGMRYFYYTPLEENLEKIFPRDDTLRRLSPRLISVSFWPASSSTVQKSDAAAYTSPGLTHEPPT